MHQIGHGALSWPADERRTDRYGTVGFNPDYGEGAMDAARWVGRKGHLIARVTETRQSHHIGDLFRGLFPPEGGAEMGAEVVLGTGRLFVKTGSDYYDWSPGGCVGLEPDDGRGVDWLDPEALYLLHDQTVDLFFDPNDEE